MENFQKQIAVFLPALYGGGAERTMFNLAQGIAGRGYAVDLVLSQAEGPYLAQMPDSIRLVDLGQGELTSRNRTLKRLPALVRYLRREQPEVMISALTRANFTAIWARRIAGAPRRLVVNEQNTLSQASQNAPSRLLRQSPRMARYFYPWADHVVGVSQGVVDDLVQVVGIPKRLVKVIHNPGVTPELREKAQSTLDDPWFEPGQPPVLLTVGSLTKQKNHGLLIEAFARLRQSRQARLLILGEGPERSLIETLAAKLGVDQHVRMPGFVDNPFPYMKRASAFILSSLWEGLPTVLVEALYCGVPIVSTDCPSGPQEILKGGEYGRLVPVDDVMALAEALATAVDGKVPRPPQESWQPYTLEAVIEQYIQVSFGDQSDQQQVPDSGRLYVTGSAETN